MNPDGIFDRSTVGLQSTPQAVVAERGRIVFFAETIGCKDAIHLDHEAANAAGYPDVVAPPTFVAVLDMLASQQQARRGEIPLMERMNCDLRRLLHGSEDNAYHGLIFAGETLELTREILSFEDKKDGALEFAHIRISVNHPQRGLLATTNRSLIHRLR